MRLHWWPRRRHDAVVFGRKPYLTSCGTASVAAWRRPGTRAAERARKAPQIPQVRVLDGCRECGRVTLGE